MLGGLKRIQSVAHSYLVWLLGSSSRSDRSAATDQELLEAIWEGPHYCTRQQGPYHCERRIIININQLACQLCGRTWDQLVGKSVAQALLETPSTAHAGTAAERWETLLATVSGPPIAVEVTRQPLGTRLRELEVYAIRDLRERHEAAAQREQFSVCLEQQHELLKAQEKKLRAQNVQLTGR